MVLWNDEGDEGGGLSFNGNQKDGNGSGGALLAFDRFRQDQTVAIQYGEENGQYSAGLRVWDRPDTSLGEVVDKLQVIQKMADGPEKTQAMQKLRETSGAGVAQRVFVGKNHDNAAVLSLSDPRGHPRIQ